MLDGFCDFLINYVSRVFSGKPSAVISFVLLVLSALWFLFSTTFLAQLGSGVCLCPTLVLFFIALFIGLIDSNPSPDDF